MRISYNWLGEYLPEKIEKNKLSNILTSVGLEVENIESYEEIKGGLNGLVVGEVIECIKHPEADKLMVTKVDIDEKDLLQIVCGAPNVKAGQKVVVAKINDTIYPVKNDPVIIKKAKIRGVESQGMLCAEDEIGIGQDHAGIIVLPNELQKGSSVAEYFATNSDWIFEIGLTPNRMDAMSHIGVAKDVCAYLSQHEKKSNVVIPNNDFKTDNEELPVKVIIENTHACQRYSGVSITNVIVKESPKWLQQKLKAIGQRPVNNIVDITNFILHETGQPLHAFDADKIKAHTIIVKNLMAGTPFTTLDEKERKLNADDLMICDGDEKPLCFGGVFGGLDSGVKLNTTNIFLESAWFLPQSIRRTSLRHGLRTDAAIHFEKGVDISNTVNVLKRAAMLIKEIAGGKISSNITDVHPNPKQKNEIILKYDYLKKLSGKNYDAETIKNILQSVGFEILNEDANEFNVSVPFNKPDILLPADVVEEIMRIDGYDNVEIPSAIIISPAVETLSFEAALKEKIANYLTGAGFSEIFTNSITNSAYYEEQTLDKSVKILNSLSTELDILRPALLETGLECIAYNINRKNNNLLFFEFGKIYLLKEKQQYAESEHLSVFITGNRIETGWKQKEIKSDFYFLKGVCEKIFESCGLKNISFKKNESNSLENSLNIFAGDIDIAYIGEVSRNKLDKFSIKKNVFFADIYWENLLRLAKNHKIIYKDLSKFPTVIRDVSIVVDHDIPFEAVEIAVRKVKITSLTNVKLFDIFKSEKLGLNKISYAVSLSFSDKEKTFTDKEVDAMLNKIIVSFEKDLNAEIRNN